MASQITAFPLFAQSFIKAQIKENIKAPRHGPFMRGIPVIGEFPSQRVSAAADFSIRWIISEIREISQRFERNVGMNCINDAFKTTDLFICGFL